MALPEAASRWRDAYARDPLSFVLHAGLVALLLWLSVSLRSQITDQMRSAWRFSLSKFDIHAQHAKPRAGAGLLLKVIYLCLLLIALYPVPGRFGYPLPEAPEALQIFIDRITQPYFRFFAIAILITMLLKDSTIAWFRLKTATSKPSARSSLKSLPGSLRCCSCLAASRLPAIISSTSATASAHSVSPIPWRRNSTSAGRPTWLSARGTLAVTFQPHARPNVAALKPNLIRVLFASRPKSRSRNGGVTNSRLARKTTGHSSARHPARVECRSKHSCRKGG